VTGGLENDGIRGGVVVLCMVNMRIAVGVQWMLRYTCLRFQFNSRSLGAARGRSPTLNSTLPPPALALPACGTLSRKGGLAIFQALGRIAVVQGGVRTVRTVV